jgi:hypothetical protein
MPRRPMNREQHEGLGLELKQIRDRLQILMLSVANRYPKAGRTSRSAMKVTAVLDSARWALDAETFRDLGERFDTRLYFPGPLSVFDETIGGDRADASVRP